jgi:hypothetical protein
MADDPERPDFQQYAQDLRADDKLADEFHGSLDILAERVKTDAVLTACFADAAKFRRLLKELLSKLGRYTEGADDAPSPRRIQGLIDEWQEARGPFRETYLKHKDYLEKLAKRFLP